jgi:hypothetical protein
MNIWIFDLSTLTYSFESKKGFLNVYSGAGELLASRKNSKNLSKREMIFKALDSALNDGKLLRSSKIYKLGLYNPHSKQVAVDGVPNTVAYSSATEIEFPKEGLPGKVVNGILETAGVELIPAEMSMRQALNAIRAHQDR